MCTSWWNSPEDMLPGSFKTSTAAAACFEKKPSVEAGGWQADTLAEDLDLSYRMQMLGYRILYLRDLVCPCEIPPTVPSFKLQQGRWACGASTAAIKILPGLLKDRKLGVKRRLQAFIHLTGYMIQPLIVFSFVLGCLAALWGVNSLRMPSRSISSGLISYLQQKPPG